MYALVCILTLLWNDVVVELRDCVMVRRAGVVCPFKSDGVD